MKVGSMRLFFKRADGGENSGVTGYFLIEWKRFFSIGLLRFDTGSRENYHSHAFNALTWWLKGAVTEDRFPTPDEIKNSGVVDHIKKEYRPSLIPKYTPRTNTHKIIAHKPTWALTFRGPWFDTWTECNTSRHEMTVLTHGRKEIIKLRFNPETLEMERI